MAKKTILVVDDTDWNRDLLVQLLEEDYTVLASRGRRRRRQENGRGKTRSHPDGSRHAGDGRLGSDPAHQSQRCA